MVKRKSSSILSPFASVPAQRIRAVANATSSPAVMFSSRCQTHPSPETKQRIHPTSFCRLPFPSIEPEAERRTSISPGNGWPEFHRYSWLQTALAQPSTRSRIWASSVDLLLASFMRISLIGIDSNIRLMFRSHRSSVELSRLGCSDEPRSW